MTPSQKDIDNNITCKRIELQRRTDINFHLRVPSGNELGADEWLWVPGGKTIKGVSEAIIEPVNDIEISIYKIKIIIE